MSRGAIVVALPSLKSHSPSHSSFIMFTHARQEKGEIAKKKETKNSYISLSNK
jgi:hypothetical protein